MPHSYWPPGAKSGRNPPSDWLIDFFDCTLLAFVFITAEVICVYYVTVLLRLVTRTWFLMRFMAAERGWFVSDNTSIWRTSSNRLRFGFCWMVNRFEKSVTVITLPCNEVLSLAVFCSKPHKFLIRITLFIEPLLMECSICNNDIILWH